MKICCLISEELRDGLSSFMMTESRHTLSLARFFAMKGHDVTCIAPSAQWGRCTPLSNVKLKGVFDRNERYDVSIEHSILPQTHIECNAKIKIHCVFNPLISRIRQTFPEMENFKLNDDQYLAYPYAEFESSPDKEKWGDKVFFLPSPGGEKFEASKFDCKEITWIYSGYYGDDLIGDMVRAMVHAADELGLDCNFLHSERLNEGHPGDGKYYVKWGFKDLFAKAKNKINFCSNVTYDEYFNILSRSKMTIAPSNSAWTHFEPIVRGLLPSGWGHPRFFGSIGEKYAWKRWASNPQCYEDTKGELIRVLGNRELYDSILNDCQKHVPFILYDNFTDLFNKIMEKL